MRSEIWFHELLLVVICFKQTNSCFPKDNSSCFLTSQAFLWSSLFRSTPCKAYKGRGDPAAEQVPRSKSWKSGPNVSQKDRWPFCSDKNMVPVKGMIFNYFPFFLLLKKRNNQSTTLYSESKQTEAPWPWLDWCSRLRKNREKEAGKKNKNQNFTSMSTSDLQWL